MTPVQSLQRKAVAEVTAEPPRFKVYTERHLDRIPQLQLLSAEQRFAMRVVAKVLDFAQMADALRSEDAARIQATVADIRHRLNPHPAGQQQLNVPRLDGAPLDGVQHKYRETLLFFPSQGQVCHSYCTFCFRWAQFIGDKELRFSAKEAERRPAIWRPISSRCCSRPSITCRPFASVPSR